MTTFCGSCGAENPVSKFCGECGAPLEEDGSAADPLPQDWEEARDPQTGRTYYQNSVTKETRWERPSADAAPDAAAKPPLPPNHPSLKLLDGLHRVSQNVGALTTSPSSMMPAVVPQGMRGGENMQGTAAQLPMQMSMSATASTEQKASLSEKFFGKRSEVHPLVEQLEDGLMIYSQTFWDDFWLTYKNQHILVSCFTVHPAHHFSANERMGVLTASLLVAFGFSAMFVPDADAEDKVAATVALTGFSALLQMGFDSLAKMSVSCSCVQRSHGCIKDTFECFGKGVFALLGLFALGIFAGGAAVIASKQGSWLLAAIGFGISKLFNFLAASSLTHLATFAWGRRGQMKPPAEELATDEVMRKWTTPTAPPCLGTCITAVAPCEKWDKHIGATLAFEDLPLHAPDYDYDVKFGCVCCLVTIYAHKATDTQDGAQVRICKSDKQEISGLPCSRAEVWRSCAEAGC